MKSNSAYKSIHNGLLLSILIGLGVFTISIILLVSSVKIDEDKVKVYLSHTTEFLDREAGKDVLVLGNKEWYNEYLSLSQDSIFMMDQKAEELINQFNPEIKQYAIRFDTTKVENAQQFYFRTSNFIRDHVFYCRDQEKLKAELTKLDASMKQKLAEVEEGYAVLGNSKKFFFNKHPKLLVWIILISMTIGFSFSLLPFLLTEIELVRQELNQNQKFIKSFGTAILIILLLMVPLMILTSDHFDYFFIPMDASKILGHGIKHYGLYWNSIFPYTGIFFWLILVFLIVANAEKTLNNALNTGRTMNEEELNTDLDHLNRVESTFERHFIVMAVFLAFTIICTNIFLNALNLIIHNDSKQTILPEEFSYTNGLMQTFFLILIYIFVISVIKKIREGLLSMKGAYTIASSSREKKKTFLDHLTLLLAVLAPVLGSGLHTLLKSVIS